MAAARSRPQQDELKDAVLRMREKGLKATGCNSAIRAINAYLHWSTAGAEVKCSPACKHLRIPQLKEPQLVLPTFTTAQVTRLVNWKPKAKVFWQRRLHLLILFLLDTGCRSRRGAQCCGCREIDFDNLLLTLDGKGRETAHRAILILSCERPCSATSQSLTASRGRCCSPGRNETQLGRRVMLRLDVKLACKRLGFYPPSIRTLHAFRHTFAVNYLRRGGSVFHLQKVLGHTTLEMTRRYAKLVPADLQAVHERVSLLRA